MITSRDVAKFANVSVSTVSRAFREDVYISKEKKNKVLAAASKLGYTPNHMAKSLKSNKSHTIGIIITDIENSFYIQITKFVENEIKKAGYRLLITFSNEDPERELECLKLLSASRVDGIIFTPSSRTNKDFIDKLRDQNILIIQTYRNLFDYLDSIVNDDEYGAYMATKHLIDHGHTQIIMTDQPNGVKINGYQRALLESNLPFDPNNIIILPVGFEFQDNLSKAIKTRNPSAIISGNNVISSYILKICENLNRNVPKDLSIIMYDDNEWISLNDITVVSHSIERLSQHITSTLFKKLNTDKQEHQLSTIKLEPVLIARNSVKNIYRQ
ncbi:LacI family DNA-binding transcriptional regulator [Paenibacillus spongiae]|uniref:LacI family transcriptional regulator n=1 Tax=Paenibacillus spongiae TaxID=2909671 RepID=A0ABY5SGK9_9BACL|nr:LacI family DNA-binding transcriptional regulator [Paenibacillus spongiae]UVI32789.1 LacI family transcriptional regulator [Paenibacillus spongiae]